MLNTVIIIIAIGLIIFIYINLSKTTPKKRDRQINKNKIIKKKLNKNKPMIVKSKKQKPKEDLVFLDIGINHKSIGKVIIKLYSDIVPKTCKNFRELCKTYYSGSPFHRIIKDFMIQGGDYTNEDGTGGKSIYGEKFEDENFVLKHDKPYLLSMANSGRNTNGSQFFITTSETSHLDGKHVVFGEIIKGFNIIDELNLVDTEKNDRPIDDIRILKCGTL